MTINTARRDWFSLDARAAADGTPATADLHIYDEIGDRLWGEGVTPRNLVAQLAELDAETIRVHINSPGGAAWDGITIMNALRRHDARIEVIVDGLAASAASVIAMAGDHITINRGAQMMVHDASGGAYGPAETMKETAAILDKLSDSLADIYAARAGGDRAQWRDVMRATTWYTAEEAVAAGLADSWVDAPAASSVESPTARFDRSIFAAAAHAGAPRFEAPELPSSSEPGEPTQKEAVMTTDTIKAGLRDRLGLTEAEISDEQYLAAVDEALAERADTTTATPEGAVLMDAAAHQQLVSDAAAGRQALNAFNAQRRDSIVDAAVAEGRIAPASRDQWRAALDENETSTAALLGTFATNTIPVAEIGHSNVAESATAEDDDVYTALFGDETKEA